MHFTEDQYGNEFIRMSAVFQLKLVMITVTFKAAPSLKSNFNDVSLMLFPPIIYY